VAFAEVSGNAVYSINLPPGLAMVAERPLFNSGFCCARTILIQHPEHLVVTRSGQVL
jgi:hypothetical protein